MKRLLPILIGLFAQTNALAAEDPFAAVEIKPTQVAGTVYMLEGAGGNVGLSIGEDGTLIVDDQFAQLGDKILKAIQALGGNNPRLILNTHFHGDHTGSNPQFGRNGTIVAHDNVRVRLLSNDDFPRSGLPLVTYDDDATVHFNNETISLIHLPSGHTDGDSVVWFKTSNVIHMGDHFFNGRFPFVDVGSGGSIDGYLANVHRVLKTIPDDIRVIPGHGVLATKTDLQHTMQITAESTKTVREKLKNGESAEAIAAELDKAYPGWGSGFISAARWVGIVQADANR
ncbi:MAG: MBL fold metallo-hydrolase [Pseudomonadota bacterium]|nr:MBL fold metallo-hydrolase [Pseudomonadota bacterium]